MTWHLFPSGRRCATSGCRRRARACLSLGGLLAALWAGTCAAARGGDPDFGPQVLVFQPGDSQAQRLIHAVFQEQEKAQFGSGRYAFLFKPGRYELDVPVGFYTHVAGLGGKPGDVTIAGHVWTDAAWMHYNATCNFWRAMENLTVEPPDGVNMWAVSQAAPMRRTHVRGDLQLWSGRGGASGGFMADCRVDGVVKSGSQQQWFSRQSAWWEWKDVNWNMVFVGCANPPPGTWPERAVTSVAVAPVIREKPYLRIQAGKWAVQMPALATHQGPILSWESPSETGQAIPIERFHIAKASVDTAASMNAQLRQGRHLLITPGLYPLTEPLVVDRPDTVILGLGFPTLMPTSGKTALRVDAPQGLVMSGLVFDAGPIRSDTLVEIGRPGAISGSPTQPACLHDLVCRVGGYGPGRCRVMVTIHSSHVVGDNVWLWRADHGSQVGWAENTCDTGLHVTGDDVTIYGLFVEHTQKHQTIWDGERGRVFFYQSEMPYDPPSPEAWRSSTGEGYASYKINDRVKAHEAWGLGVYHVFVKAPVIAARAIETPASPDLQLRHLFTFRLGGGKPGSGIRQVINQRGGETIQAQKAMVD